MILVSLEQQIRTQTELSKNCWGKWCQYIRLNAFLYTLWNRLIYSNNKWPLNNKHKLSTHTGQKSGKWVCIKGKWQHKNGILHVWDSADQNVLDLIQFRRFFCDRIWFGMICASHSDPAVLLFGWITKLEVLKARAVWTYTHMYAIIQLHCGLVHLFTWYPFYIIWPNVGHTECQGHNDPFLTPDSSLRGSLGCTYIYFAWEKLTFKGISFR